MPRHRRDYRCWAAPLPILEDAEIGSGLGTVCVYQASSPEAIRAHAQAAGLPLDEIVKVGDTVVVRPDPQPATV